MRRLICALAAATLLAAPALPQGRGKGHGRGHAREETKGGPARSGRPFDSAVIGDYYRGGLPPGLAKRNGLPPGLEKQLRRNGTLPPGLARKVAPFPMELETRLAPCPPEVRRGIVGGVAIMYNSRTGLIIDSTVIVGR